jgi:4,5-DOPA dioxygenase extradiol
VRECLLARDHAALINYPALDPEARLSVPTPEHYLPLLYIIAQQGDDDSVSLPIDGIELGSISMLTVMVAPPPD